MTLKPLCAHRPMQAECRCRVSTRVRLYADMQVVEAFKILTSDKQVKAILVNIFGTVHLLPQAFF